MAMSSRFTHDVMSPIPSPETIPIADYLAMVGHDLKTPLTVIKGYAGTLLNPACSADEAHRATYARRIAAAADQMARMIDRMLTAGRVDAPDFRPFLERLDLAESIRRATARDRAGSHTFRVDLPGEPIVLFADPDLIERVLENLLSNAVKYSPDGGEIEVGARVVGGSTGVGPWIGPVSMVRGWAVLWVRDQGVGIPHDQIGRVFDRYVRVVGPEEKAMPGSGLGLYICKRVVEAHGGKVWVESCPGRGSTFYIGLPGVRRK